MTLVDSNTNLLDIQKFYYLKGALKGSAADIIHSLEVSSANYREAWVLLRERFENRKLIALSHIESMYTLPSMVKESQAGLRKFVDEIRKDLRALKSLGLGVEHWDALLIYIFEMKLDPITRKEWQREGSVDTFATIEEFLRFLAKKCTVLETTVDIGENSGRGKPAQGNRHQLKAYGAFEKPHCLVCKSLDHYIQRCRTFLDMTLQKKREFVTRSNLCWNCLRHGHRVHSCTFNGCRICKGKHHSLLHVDQAQSVAGGSNQQGKSEVRDQNGTNGGVKNKSNFNGHSSTASAYRVQGGEQVSEVLLSTAIIKVEDNQGKLYDCRALLDCGSQYSFMTRELGSKLGIPSKRINMSILGIGPGVTNITHSVNTRIHSAHSDYNVDTGFLLIDKISNNIPSTNVKVGEIRIPENIILADASFGKPGKIDILLGASIFWDILEGDKINLGKGKPIIQGTKLGYVVAGPVGSGFEFNREQHCKFASTLSVQDQLEKFWHRIVNYTEATALSVPLIFVVPNSRGLEAA